MKIASIVVVYNSNLIELYNNIKRIISCVDILIVWRNSNDDVNFLKSINEDKILFMGNGENLFIAEPLNVAVDWCLRNNYDYLLTMDQDSEWVNFDYFVNFVRECKDDETVIYAPNVNYKKDIKEPMLAVDSVITSGSLLNVKIVNKLGGFRNDYKIYWVDGEFCYWSRKNGYKIRIITSANLLQKFGNETKIVFGFTTSNYSAVVYYYIFRNMLWMHREHGNNAVSIKCILYTSLYNLRGIILGESHKLEKVKSIYDGIIDGCFKHINKR